MISPTTASGRNLLAVAAAILVMSVCLSCARKENLLPDVATDSYPVTIIIDTDQVVPIPPDFFGLHFNMAATAVSYNTPGVMERLKSLQPATLTYPPRPVANFTDWLSGLVRRDWIDTGSDPQAPATSHLRQTADFVAIKGGISFSDFAEACQNLGAMPVISVNIQHKHPDDTRRWAEMASTRGIQPDLWLMARQPWQEALRKDSETAMDTLLAKADSHLQALHSVLPEARVGIDVPSQILTGDLFDPEDEQTARLIAWVQKVREKKELAASIDLNLTLDADPDAPAERVHYALSQRIRPRVHQIIANAAFYFEREIWVDEWSLGLHPQPKGFSGSMIRALAMADMALALCDALPALHRVSYGDGIGLLGIGNERELQAQVVQTFQEQGRLINTSRHRPKYTAQQPAAAVMEMIGSALRQSDRKAALHIYHAPVLDKSNKPRPAPVVSDPEIPAALVAAAFLGRDGTLRIAMLNRSNAPHVIRLVLDSRAMGGKVQARFIAAPDLLPSPDAPPPRSQRRVYPANKIDLPPYSFTMLEAGIQP